jgi:hypothetical protein
MIFIFIYYLSYKLINFVLSTMCMQSIYGFGIKDSRVKKQTHAAKALNDN